MVYDNTKEKPEFNGERGYAIHRITGKTITYELYTDDGRGNGEYICVSDDLYWIRRIAYSMDIADSYVVNDLGMKFNMQGELE